MIFASDLDQTLIYSENFLSKNTSNAEDLKQQKLQIIEYYQGAPLSYIHNEAVGVLQEIDAKNCFVPVTTRTEEQYKRIDFSKFGISPQYAVTTNGAKVLLNGEVDKNWESQVQKKLARIDRNHEQLCELVDTIIDAKVIKKMRRAEDVFSYCVLYRDLLDLKQVEAICKVLEPEGWSISLQGTKLYFMPKVISKWDAVEYVSNQLGSVKVVSAGDSLLDLPLLCNSFIGWIPEHGEIYSQNLHHTKQLLTSGVSGIEASVAISKKASLAIASK